jgi:hypothetical protein
LAAPGEWVPELCDAAALTVDGDLVYVSVAGTGGGADRIAAIRVVRLLEGGQAEVIRELDVPDELGAALWRPAVRDGVAYVVQRQFPSDPDTSRLITLDLRSDAVRIVDELRGVYGALAFGPGGMVYLASAEPARLISIDASDPSDLRVTDEQDFPELAPQPPENRPLGLRGVAAIGSALYAASERGLYVFDAQDPRHPRQAAVTPAIGDLLGWTDSALLTMECCARSDIVRVDLRRPLAPRIDARLVNPTEGLYPSMAIEIGGRLIVGWTDYGSYAARTSALGGMYVYPSP